MNQRFYLSSYGRFLTPDRFQGQAKGASDPVNNNDPQGMYLPECPVDGGCWGDGGWGWVRHVRRSRMIRVVAFRICLTLLNDLSSPAYGSILSAFGTTVPGWVPGWGKLVPGL